MHVLTATRRTLEEANGLKMWASQLQDRPPCHKGSTHPRMFWGRGLGGATGHFWQGVGGDEGWVLASEPLRFSLSENIEGVAGIWGLTLLRAYSCGSSHPPAQGRGQWDSQYPGPGWHWHMSSQEAWFQAHSPHGCMHAWSVTSFVSDSLGLYGL